MRGPRRRSTRYYVRNPADRHPEVARVTGRGSSAVYDRATQTWVNDPLLATTIRITGEWLRIAPEELPADVVVPGTAAHATQGRTRRRVRGGRHSSHAAPG